MKRTTSNAKSTSNKSFTSSFSRRINSILPISRRSTSEPAKSKNEFGLNTVYEPDDETSVIADLVFVHGLGGGSSTTWCLKGNLEYFWPKEWLPEDPDFDRVRIHSFGYNANWATWLKSPADIHAFGQSLVEELRSDPRIHGQNTRIVLIGHSMGGLVIKKACIISKTTRNFADIASRLHSFYFLGTPHRGSNLAGTLNNLLRLSGSGRRAYVSGLETKSDVIRVLNDEFRNHYTGIHLHTFYESLPTAPLGMIVDVESATLGYAEERVQLMNANHRDLAKFESVEDSNYRSLRNRLASTMHQIRKEHQEGLMASSDSEPAPRAFASELSTQLLSSFQQMESIAAYLSVDHSPDDNLSSLNETRFNGSCSWLTAKSSYREWQSSHAPRYFWLKGAPASGKSTIASYVVEHLKDSPVCFYFFKTGEKRVPDLSSFLRSMAYQMARVNPIIRNTLFQLSKNQQPVEVRNHKSIWHNVFTSCIFHVDFHRPHFWVIDALDEVAERGPVDEYFRLLSKIDSNIPLKVFITSQPNRSFDGLFSRLPTVTEVITAEDSLPDIRLYVKSWSVDLPVNDEMERSLLVERIVDMSGGSFLWTVLVIKQLQEVFTVTEVHDVLGEIPERMTELYQHNIKKMETSRSKSAAKHMIMWAICSVTPLTVDEMKDAIRLTLGTEIARDLRTSLQYLCGQFLDIDKQSRIQLVHGTARKFLISSELDSEFRIDATDGHRLIAMACLKHLSSDELRYSKRRRSSSTKTQNKTAMTDYACLRFSEHVFRASSSSDDLFEALVKFFSTNVLTWIEYVAQLKDLYCLNRTAKHLNHYLGRRMKHMPILKSDLAAWVIDLPRIVTQFGVNLLNDPTTIHSLVPPFCPRSSAVYRNFGYAEDGIKLVGVSDSVWGDRICSISYHETYTTVVAARDERFAVGLSNGFTKIYRTSTCEELLSLEHQESISVLEFGSTAKFIATAGLRYLRLWDTATGTQLFCINTESQILALTFDETESHVIIVSRNEHVSAYQLVDGSLLYELPWSDTQADSDFAPAPSAAKITIEQQIVAIVYRSRPVQLWSLEKKHRIGACIRPATNKHGQASHIVVSMVFNPSPTNPRLLVSYWDEVLVTFDSITCKPVAWTSAGLHKIAIAPNGKTIAGSDGVGGIKIYDFETLQFLRRVQAEGDPISYLAFTSDSLRIIDAKGTQANVWEPLVLMSQDPDSHSSEPSESVHQIVDDVPDSISDQSTDITTLYCCEQSGIAFCGRNNGRVDTCNLDDPENTMRNLYKHRGSFTSVTCIDWSHASRTVVSADSSGNFRVMKITTGSRREWGAELLLEARLEQGRTINQILVHTDGSLLLISSSESDSVWSIPEKKTVAFLKERKRVAWKWFIHPSTPSQLLLFEDKVLRLFKWENLDQIAISKEALPPAQIERRESNGSTNLDAISISSEGDDLVFVQRLQPTRQEFHSTSSEVSPTTKIHLFDISSLSNPPSLQSEVSSTAPLTPSSPFESILINSPRNEIPHLSNPFSATTGTTPPRMTTFPSTSSMPTHRRSSVRNVANIPDVESIIGTVKKFNWWYLVFLSKTGWVCSIEIGGGGRSILDTFQKHFFIPSVWRTGNPSLLAKVRRSQDIILVHHNRVIVIKNGLDDGEHISIF